MNVLNGVSSAYNQAQEESIKAEVELKSDNKTDYSRWVYFENHRNGIATRASNNLATFSEFPVEYRPGGKPYQVSLYEVDKVSCKIFVSNRANKALITAYVPTETTRIPFPVHPVNLLEKTIPHIQQITKKLLTQTSVQSTSSTRTVFVLDNKLPPHCLKPHTNLTITKWKRHMELRKVKQAVEVTKIFETTAVFNNNSHIAYYPESIGVVYGGDKPTDWGYIVREMQSRPLVKQAVQMMPLCSLYMPDAQKPNERPVLLDLIEKSKESPEKFILNRIIYPLLDGWIKIYLETGVLLEPHGQNVVVEFDEAGKILRFAQRDFDCVINTDIVTSFKDKGININNLNKYDLFSSEGDTSIPQGCYLSVYFDNSMRVPLDAMAALVESHFKIPVANIQAECREYLIKKYPDVMNKHFPRDGSSYKYEKKSHQEGDVVMEGNEVVRSDRPLAWRDAPRVSK